MYVVDVCKYVSFAGLDRLLYLFVSLLNVLGSYICARSELELYFEFKEEHARWEHQNHSQIQEEKPMQGVCSSYLMNTLIALQGVH
jgi:hypothetical protein